MRLPPLPRAIWTPHGAVTVARPRKTIRVDRTACNGAWSYDRRQIEVSASLPRARAWWTFFHERAHSTLDDYAVKVPGDLEEAICDAVANADMAKFTRLCEQCGPDAALASVMADG